MLNHKVLIMFFVSCFINSVPTAAEGVTEEQITIKHYVKQLRKHSNFHWFAVLNLVQVSLKVWLILHT